MAEETEPNYDCTQLELYSITELGYNNLENSLPDFTAYNTNYDAAKVTALRLVRTNAMNLPDVEQRNEKHEVLGGILEKEDLPPLLDNFQKLKGYIESGWPDENPKPRYESAGMTKYRAAQNFNWENAAGLAKNTREFIAANTAILTVPGGMPAAFAGKCAGDETKFNDNYTLFKVARETTVAKGEKIKANNELNKQLKGVLRDGADRVYRTDAEKQKGFTFVYLKGLVSPPGSASLEIELETAGNLPIAGKEIMIKTEGEPAMTVTTDDKGVAFYKSINPGVYDGELDNNGTDYKFKKDVDKGVNARLKITL